MKRLGQIFVRVLACFAVAVLLVGLASVPSLLWAASAAEEEAIVVHCVDKRYGTAEHVVTLPEGYHFCAVGCSQRFVKSEVTRADFYEDLAELQQKGVNVSKIIFVDHRTCKAYADDSPEAHVKNLRAAAQLIRRDVRSRSLKVELYLHDMAAHRCIPVSQE